VTTGIDSPAATIVRIWRGKTRQEDADEYAVYMPEEGLRDMELGGALAVQVFREDQGEETVFVALTYWESFETMAAWAGDNPYQVHHLPRDPEFLIEMPERVQVLDIVENTWSDLLSPVILFPLVSFPALDGAVEVADLELTAVGSA
jgi:heme-degrading monooxygenase HmoA